MPRSAHYTLKWSEEQKCSTLYEQGQPIMLADGKEWFAWLMAHTSFAFHGPQIRFTLLKETRKNKGEGYWYAYQRQGKRTVKRYVGRSIELTTVRLLEIGREFQPPAPSSSLLELKFRLPRLHSSLVSRERLFKRLDAGMEQVLILLIAPAGSGKTTLVRQWIAERHDFLPQVAWLSLDNGDNDPIRFWRYIITVCEPLLADGSNAALVQLATLSQMSFEVSLLEAALTPFLNDLGRLTQKSILVLEDYHVITSPAIQQTVAFLLHHLPPSLQLVILTRNNPVLPLAQLHLKGNVSTIGANDLRFTHEEMLAFLKLFSSEQFALGEIQQLEQQLDGWAAGLRLFVLSLHESKSLDEHLANFVGRKRSLQEYFIGEILNIQPAQRQEFLLCTSLLDRLTASLCDAITGGRNSTEQLKYIEQSGLFLERLEGPEEWYRYHALFAEAMRVEARRRLGAEQVHAIALQASHWYEQRGMLPDAIETALQAQEMKRVALLIEQRLTITGLEEMQESYTLRRWMEPLPEEILRYHPLLCLCRARVLSLYFVPGHPSSAALLQIEQLLQLAETEWSIQNNTTRLGEVFSFRAVQMLNWYGERERALDYAKRALDYLPEEASNWRGVCLTILGGNELFAGQPLRANKILQESLAVWTATQHIHGARGCTLLLGDTYVEQGTLQLAAVCYRQVIEEARELGDREDLLPALLGLAQLYYEWNDLPAAEQAAQEVYASGEQMQSLEMITHAGLLLARIWFVQGQKVQAQQRLILLRSRTQARQDLLCEIALCQMRFLYADGDYAAIQHNIEALSTLREEASFSVCEQIDLFQVRVFLSRREFEAATVLLEKMDRAAQQAGRRRRLLEIQLLNACVQNARQRIADGRQILQTVLSFAHPEGYVRLFLEQEREITVLLHTLQAYIYEQPLVNYLQTLLHAFGPVQVEPISLAGGQLSPQEQRVLRLLVAEFSYPEIARELVVSINTVKTQVNSIYRKLNVHNRREARAIVLAVHKEMKNHELG